MPRCSEASFCGLAPHVAAQPETRVPALTARYVPTTAERHMSSTKLMSTWILHDHLGRAIKVAAKQRHHRPRVSAPCNRESNCCTGHVTRAVGLATGRAMRFDLPRSRVDRYSVTHARYSTRRRAPEARASKCKRGVSMKFVLVLVMLVLAGSATAIPGCPPGTKHQCMQGKGHVVCSCH